MDWLRLGLEWSCFLRISNLQHSNSMSRGMNDARYHGIGCYSVTCAVVCHHTVAYHSVTYAVMCHHTDACHNTVACQCYVIALLHTIVLQIMKVGVRYGILLGIFKVIWPRVTMSWMDWTSSISDREMKIRQNWNLGTFSIITFFGLCDFKISLFVHLSID